MSTLPQLSAQEDYCGTSYAAKLLGLSVGTIQNLVEKNELQAWKTQGGHRRISMQSIREYQRRHNIISSTPDNSANHLKVLLVEDDEVTREMLRTICNNCEVRSPHALCRVRPWVLQSWRRAPSCAICISRTRAHRSCRRHCLAWV